MNNAKLFRPEHAVDHPSRKPWISNYPPLQAWIDKHENAMCRWQERIGQKMMLEGWVIDGVLVIIEILSDGHGWNIYTASPYNTIVHALADADARIEEWRQAAKSSRSGKEA